MTPPLHESDKVYWHRYLEFYESSFAELGRVAAVLEFGVFKGDSIRWLAERFPDAAIIGCDIVPPQASWPQSSRIEYVTIDQGSVEQLRQFFEERALQFDLVIEDGSHQPIHQRNCLVETLPHVRPDGLYVLEDLHTSHPQHQLYRALGRTDVVGPLHLLLALEHLRSIGAELDEATLMQLSTSSLFKVADVDEIFRRIASIAIYKRSTLPRRCYRCGSSAFDYHALRCTCGVDVHDTADSMSAVLRLAPSA
jgi:hypothetical protein